MKELKFPAYPDSTHLLVEDLEYLSDALKHVCNGLSSVLGNQPNVPYRLSGCEIENGNLSDGWILYNGQVYKVTGGSATPSSSLNFKEEHLTRLTTEGEYFNVQTTKSLELSEDGNGIMTVQDLKEVALFETESFTVKKWDGTGNYGNGIANRVGNIVNITIEWTQDTNLGSTGGFIRGIPVSFGPKKSVFAGTVTLYREYNHIFPLNVHPLKVSAGVFQVATSADFIWKKGQVITFTYSI